MEPRFRVEACRKKGNKTSDHSTRTYALFFLLNVPILISLGSNLGGMLSLSSDRLELVRVSDEPEFGTTDYCCTFTTKREKGWSVAAAGLYRAMNYRETKTERLIHGKTLRDSEVSRDSVYRQQTLYGQWCQEMFTGLFRFFVPVTFTSLHWRSEEIIIGEIDYIGEIFKCIHPF